jgi:hypothetical protein
MKRLRQFLCAHWFDEPVTFEFSESRGPIICTQQKMWTITRQSRTCSKCGFTDSRRIGDPVYEGWV